MAGLPGVEQIEGGLVADLADDDVVGDSEAPTDLVRKAVYLHRDEAQ